MKNTLNLILMAVAITAITATFSACDNGETFTDPRDGQKYKTVKIGDQVWMAENLKFKGGATRIKENGSKFVWDSALVACPDGWHLPSKVELESVASDTSFQDIWSSTEKEDFTYSAYAKGSDEIFAGVKEWYDGCGAYVRCIQGAAEPPKKLTTINGYKAVRVGNQIWMANNLDIKTPNSICYLDDENECSKGRFYPYAEAKKVCPEGWHLPSKTEAAKFVTMLKRVYIEFSTNGYYEAKTEQFAHLWGNAVLWTDTYGFVIIKSNSGHREWEIWEGSSFIKSDGWKIAVRCIADAEENKAE